MKKLMNEYRALCALGLPTSDLVPLALALLDRALGGNYNGFGCVDAQLDLVGAYMLFPLDQDALDRYHQEFHNRKEAEVVPGFKDSLIHKIPLVNYAKSHKDYYQSTLYREYASAVGVYHALRATVIDNEQRYGMLAIGRGMTERAYTEQEETLYMWAARLLAQAFELERVQKLVHAETFVDKPEGFLLVDETGRVLHGSDLGLRWLQDVARFPNSGIVHPSRVPVAWLTEAQQNGAGGEMTISVDLGQFVFRPLKLHSIESEAVGSPTFVITIRRHGSLASLIWQEADRFKLSARERQVAVFLGAGYSNEEIARRLGVATTTAITYVQRVFGKLGIDKREQLLMTILR
ncbi:MAG: LuxR C-terminal-related transcriptional regulator [Candidatus Competibacter denitrificans]